MDGLTWDDLRQHLKDFCSFSLLNISKTLWLQLKGKDHGELLLLYFYNKTGGDSDNDSDSNSDNDSNLDDSELLSQYIYIKNAGDSDIDSDSDSDNGGLLLLHFYIKNVGDEEDKEHYGDAESKKVLGATKFKFLLPKSKKISVKELIVRELQLENCHSAKKP